MLRNDSDETLLTHLLYIETKNLKTLYLCLENKTKTILASTNEMITNKIIISWKVNMGNFFYYPDLFDIPPSHFLASKESPDRQTNNNTE